MKILVIDHGGAHVKPLVENLEASVRVGTAVLCGGTFDVLFPLLFFRDYGEEVSRRDKTTGTRS